MKVVILSDLNWRDHLRDLQWNDVLQFTEADLDNPAFERIARNYQIIIQEQAELVLLAGDITGDGFCGHGFQYALLALVSLLEQKGIPSAYITGNHDPSPYFDEFVEGSKQFKLTHHISNKLITINGLNVLGINFHCTKSKSSLNKVLIENKETPVHICLAHSEIKRRIRLFDTHAQLIVTGHYDRKLFPFRQSVFISLDNDSEEVSYATAVFENGELLESSICIRQNEHRTIYLPYKINQAISPYLFSEGKAVASFDKLEAAHDSSFRDDEGNDWTYLKYLRGLNHRAAYESLYYYKKEKMELEGLLPLSDIHKLKISPGYRISSLFIRDYIGKVSL